MVLFIQLLVRLFVIVSNYDLVNLSVPMIDNGNKLTERINNLKSTVSSLVDEQRNQNEELHILSNVMKDLKDTSDYNIAKLEMELWAERRNFRRKENYLRYLKTLHQKENEEAQLFMNQIPGRKGDVDGFHRGRFLVTDNTMNTNVGFSAIMNSHKEHLAIHQTVKFEHVWTNLGSGYNPSTGLFTAPQPGLYFFSVVILSHQMEDIETEIAKNDQSVVITYSGDSTTWNAGSQSAVLRLNKNDVVRVRIYNYTVVNDGNVRVFGQGWSSYCGFMISQ